MDKLLSASVMCADLTRLQDSIFELENAGVDYLHIDIMDGSFVPNITLGFDLVNAIKSIASIPLDVHMMVNEPSRFIDRMNLDERDYLCVHYEADIHVQRTLAQIRDKGCKTGLALNPQTPLDSLEYLTDYIDMALIMTVSPGFAGQKLFEGAQRKTQQARELLDKWGCSHIPIEVDGNISFENGKKLSRCGADIFVLGTSSLFIKDKEMKQSVRDFRAVL
ncbi:MAG: ribulose-phosphate 3-epimerase [Clostridia bacterium]|nr:ribulose-phosphate 3-epimerase [Clostridia bacterium]